MKNDGAVTSLTSKWVKESKFGVWFLNTKTWIDHVLKLSLNDLESLLDSKEESYSVILDIGFGHANSFLELEKRFDPDMLIGVDVDPDCMQWSKANLAKCKCETKLLIANASQIDLPDDSVDMVFCHQTFHHIVEQEAAMREFYRVLKKGGVLLFAESCKRYIHSFIIKVLFRHPMDVQKTDEEYLTLIKRAGFKFQNSNILKPFLWWSRPDLGTLEFFGIKPKTDREETLLYIVAYK